MRPVRAVTWRAGAEASYDAAVLWHVRKGQGKVHRSYMDRIGFVTDCGLTLPRQGATTQARPAGARRDTRQWPPAADRCGRCWPEIGG